MKKQVRWSDTCVQEREHRCGPPPPPDIYIYMKMYLCALNSRAYVGFLILSGQRIAYSLGKRHGRLANSMFVMTSSFFKWGPVISVQGYNVGWTNMAHIIPSVALIDLLLSRDRECLYVEISRGQREARASVLIHPRYIDDFRVEIVTIQFKCKPTCSLKNLLPFRRVATITPKCPGLHIILLRYIFSDLWFGY